MTSSTLAHPEGGSCASEIGVPVPQTPGQGACCTPEPQLTQRNQVYANDSIPNRQSLCSNGPTSK